MGYGEDIRASRIPLDNDVAERSLCGPAVGQKAHYGSKSKRGTEVAAFFNTLFEPAKLQGVEPADTSRWRPSRPWSRRLKLIFAPAQIAKQNTDNGKQEAKHF